MSDVAARLEAVRKLEREVAALERKLRTEPQLNRKVELRRALKNEASDARRTDEPDPKPNAEHEELRNRWRNCA